MLTRQARSADLTRFTAEAHQPWGWWQHHPGPVTRWQEGEQHRGRRPVQVVLPRAPRSERPSGGSSSAPWSCARGARTSWNVRAAYWLAARLTGGRKVENTRTAGSVRSTGSCQDDAERVGVYVIFDGPPGPEAGRFVEVEDADGNSIRAGEWADRGDGYWSLHVGVLAPGDAGYDAGYDDGLRVARESWAVEKNAYEARIAGLERTIERIVREIGGKP